MPYRPFEDQNCSIAAALAVLGERWTLLVLREAMLGRTRFAQLQRNLGVAPNILADRLQTLVDHGLLARRESSGRAGASEYRLTERGADVQPVLAALMEWGDHHAAPADGPPRRLVHERCGHHAALQVRCEHCDEALEPHELLVRPGPGATPAQRDEGPLPSHGRTPRRQ